MDEAYSYFQRCKWFHVASNSDFSTNSVWEPDSRSAPLLGAVVPFVQTRWLYGSFIGVGPIHLHSRYHLDVKFTLIGDLLHVRWWSSLFPKHDSHKSTGQSALRSIRAIPLVKPLPLKKVRNRSGRPRRTHWEHNYIFPLEICEKAPINTYSRFQISGPQQIISSPAGFRNSPSASLPNLL